MSMWFGGVETFLKYNVLRAHRGIMLVTLLPLALTSKHNYIVILYSGNFKPTILSKVGFVCPLLRNKIACPWTVGQTKQNTTGRADRSRARCVRLLFCGPFRRLRHVTTTVRAKCRTTLNHLIPVRAMYLQYDVPAR